MKTSEGVKFFGNKLAMAKALGLSRAAISQWGDNIPELRAFQIKVLMEKKRG